MGTIIVNPKSFWRKNKNYKRLNCGSMKQLFQEKTPCFYHISPLVFLDFCLNKK